MRGELVLPRSAHQQLAIQRSLKLLELHADRRLGTMRWTIPQGTPPGEYRLVHYGDSKAPVTGRISSFSGASRSFLVQ